MGEGVQLQLGRKLDENCLTQYTESLNSNKHINIQLGRSFSRNFIKKLYYPFRELATTCQSIKKVNLKG